jgi:WD40 repeat protein
MLLVAPGSSNEQNVSQIDSSEFTLSTDAVIDFEESMYDVAFTPDGKHIATIRRHYSPEAFDLTLWSIEQRRKIERRSMPGKYDRAYFSYDGGTLALHTECEQQQQIVLFKTKNLRRAIRTVPVTDWPCSMRPDGQFVALTGDIGPGYDIRLISTERNVGDHALNLEEGIKKRPDGVLFSPTGWYFSAWYRHHRGTTHIWNLATQKHRQVPYYYPVFSHDSRMLSTTDIGGPQPQVHIWNAENGEELGSISVVGHWQDDYNLQVLAFGPKNNRLVTCFNHKTRDVVDGLVVAQYAEPVFAGSVIQAWDISSGRKIHERKLDDEYVLAANFKNDKCLVATRQALYKFDFEK